MSAAQRLGGTLLVSLVSLVSGAAFAGAPAAVRTWAIAPPWSEGETGTFVRAGGDGMVSELSPRGLTWSRGGVFTGVRWRPVGAREDAAIRPIAPALQTHPTLRGFHELELVSAWDGVSVRVTSERRGVRYTIDVAAGTHVSHIRFDYDGARSIRMTEDGRALEIETALGRLRESGLRCFVRRAGAEHELPCRYTPAGTNGYGFDVDGWSGHEPLVIDPVVTWDVPFTTPEADAARAVAAYCDSLFVVGETGASGLQTKGQAFGGKMDIFVARLLQGSPDKDLTTAWVINVGGAELDRPADIRMTSTGDVVIAGSTYSPLFLGTSTGEHTPDGVLVRVDKDGDVVWHTVIGRDPGTPGGEPDTHQELRAVLPDGTGGAWFAGSVARASSDATVPLGPPGPEGNEFKGGASDALVGYVDGQGAIKWVNYLGGVGADEALALARIEGDILVAGFTGSSGFPITGVSPPHQGGEDAFVARLTASGDLVWSRLLGGAGDDRAIALEVRSGSVLVGLSSSGGFPTFDGGSTQGGDFDGVVTMLDKDGVEQWSVRIGGDSADHLTSLALTDDSVIAGGGTRSGTSLLGSELRGEVVGGQELFFTELPWAGAPGTYGPSWLLGRPLHDDLLDLTWYRGRLFGAARSNVSTDGGSDFDGWVFAVDHPEWAPVQTTACDVYEGRPPSDGGMPAGDGGTGRDDAGVHADAGMASDGGDGGTTTPDGKISPLGWSCGCGASGGGALFGLGALLLALRATRSSRS